MEEEEEEEEGVDQVFCRLWAAAWMEKLGRPIIEEAVKKGERELL